MQYRLCALALAALCSTSLAAPSAHGAHRRAHESLEEKRQNIDWNNPDLYTGVNWATVNYGGQKATSVAAAPAAPAQTTAAAAPSGGKAAPSKSTSGSSSSGSSGTANTGVQLQTAFGGVTAPTGSGYAYVGNLGSPFGSNVILIEESLASQFNYVVKFVSTASSTRKIIITNKAGPDGKPNTGYYESANAIAKQFELAPGSTQYAAFDTDSSGMFCDWTSGQLVGDVMPNGQQGSKGMYQCAFGEFDFGSSVNKGWSGYDVSMIQNMGGACNLKMQATNGALSTCTENMYTTANEDAGGIGGNLAPGNVLLTATFGDP